MKKFLSNIKNDNIREALIKHLRKEEEKEEKLYKAWKRKFFDDSEPDEEESDEDVPSTYSLQKSKSEFREIDDTETTESEQSESKSTKKREKESEDSNIEEVSNDNNSKEASTNIFQEESDTEKDEIVTSHFFTSTLIDKKEKIETKNTINQEERHNKSEEPSSSNWFLFSDDSEDTTEEIYSEKPVENKPESHLLERYFTEEKEKKKSNEEKSDNISSQECSLNKKTDLVKNRTNKKSRSKMNLFNLRKKLPEIEDTVSDSEKDICSSQYFSKNSPKDRKNIEYSRITTNINSEATDLSCDKLNIISESLLSSEQIIAPFYKDNQDEIANELDNEILINSTLQENIREIKEINANISLNSSRKCNETLKNINYPEDIFESNEILNTSESSPLLKEIEEICLIDIEHKMVEMVPTQIRTEDPVLSLDSGFETICILSQDRSIDLDEDDQDEILYSQYFSTESCSQTNTSENSNEETEYEKEFVSSQYFTNEPHEELGECIDLKKQTLKKNIKMKLSALKRKKLQKKEDDKAIIEKTQDIELGNFDEEMEKTAEILKLMVSENENQIGNTTKKNIIEREGPSKRKSKKRLSEEKEIPEKEIKLDNSKEGMCADERKEAEVDGNKSEEIDKTVEGEAHLSMLNEEDNKEIDGLKYIDGHSQETNNVDCKEKKEKTRKKNTDKQNIKSKTSKSTQEEPKNEFSPDQIRKYIDYPFFKKRPRRRLPVSDLPELPPGALVPLWTPPRSPHGLIEEDYVKNPWGLLVATIFLNKTNGRQARPYIDAFLEKFPTPEKVLEKEPKDFEIYFEELGLKKRAERIWRMSKDFLEKNWRHARELHGIGKYGDDAFRIFCIGDLKLEPTDRYLKIYHAWVTKKDFWQEESR